MASKIGDVLKIELIELYVRRPAGPMITPKIHDINKLARYICIPSMAESATPKDTTLQKNCIQAYQTSAKNVAALATSLEPTLYPKRQFGMEAHL